jgi:predicted ABC-type ATPase
MAPEDVIVRRYYRGIKNLFDIYLNIVDQVIIFDSSESPPKTIAYKQKVSDFSIIDVNKFNKIKSNYYENR